MRSAKRLTVVCLVSAVLATSTITAVAEETQPTPATSSSPAPTEEADTPETTPVPEVQASEDPSPTVAPSTTAPTAEASVAESVEPSSSPSASSSAPPTSAAPAARAAEVEAVPVQPKLSIKADTGRPVGTEGYVSGTVSPAGKVKVVVQASYDGQWHTVSEGSTDAGGAFKLKLARGLNSVGVHKFRVQTTYLGKTLTSSTIVFTRTPSITYTHVTTKVIHFASYVRGTVKGASSRTVTLQYRTGGKWKSVASGKADSSGKFKIKLYRTVAPGSHSYRLRVESKVGKAYSSTFTQQRIVGWKATIANTRASEVKHTYKTGCPVGTSGLSTITMTYWNYDGKIRTGTMIVRRDVAKKVRAAFKEAFYDGFKINRMSNPDVWKADDIKMMAANNTSAFNCRKVTGNPYRVSPHSYGRSIDVNTYENPYRVGGNWYPSSKYGSYRPKVKGLLHSGSTLVKELKKRGFDWYSGWDWQHFQR